MMPVLRTDEDREARLGHAAPPSRAMGRLDPAPGVGTGREPHLPSPHALLVLVQQRWDSPIPGAPQSGTKAFRICQKEAPAGLVLPGATPPTACALSPLVWFPFQGVCVSHSWARRWLLLPRAVGSRHRRMGRCPGACRGCARF